MTATARRALALVAGVGLLRLLGAFPLGLGDAEALYAVYAQQLQGGYLDHPPLIGWLDAAVLALWSSPLALRLLALALFSLSAWLLFRLARELFDEASAWVAVVLLCVTPVFHLGGLAAAPDAPLSPLWLGTLWVAWRAWKRIREEEPSWGWVVSRAALAGGLLGAAFLGKYSALALAPVLAVAAWPLPWAKRLGAFAVGAAAALLVASPVLAWNLAHDFASVRHRLWWSQPETGLSLRNLGALVGGQLGYLSPVVAVLLGWAVVRGGRMVRGWAVADAKAPPARASAIRFCLVGTLVPFALLGSVCLWSRVAEPHWPLPAYLALLPLAGTLVAGATTRGVRRLYGWAVGVAAAFDVLAYVVVLTPVLPAVVPEPLYVAKYDLVNELYGWDDVAAAVRRRVPEGGVVAAGHYTMCAQLAWNLRDSGIEVGCRTATPSDFDFRAPGRERLASSPVLWVSDERYPGRPERTDGAALPEPVQIVEIRRGGTTVRRFALTSYPVGTVAWRRLPCDSTGRESN
ncbi:MAG: glycosyltransferase family 39 protein [Deltaproteobacteria bacterium]|nr:glycosyltransferase family 39 protein [Deltaproteobacteria bacterium]